MKLRPLLGAILCAVLLAVSALGQETKRIPAAQSGQHIGEHATVCGIVASTRYLSSSRSKPTFLNFGKPYPNEDFTVVIWPDDRQKFGHPEETYLHKNICVSGEISSYQGKPQIVVRVGFPQSELDPTRYGVEHAGGHGAVWRGFGHRGDGP